VFRKQTRIDHAMTRHSFADLINVIELVNVKYAVKTTSNDDGSAFDLKRELLRALANLCCDNASVVEEVSVLCLSQAVRVQTAYMQLVSQGVVDVLLKNTRLSAHDPCQSAVCAQ
jgi:hypothetical protein